jgi:hypothetical protein
MPKLIDQISVRVDAETRATLREIELRHRLTPPEFVRGLLEAGIACYRANGWFAFPVEVKPEREYVRAVAESMDAKMPLVNPPKTKSKITD